MDHQGPMQQVGWGEPQTHEPNQALYPFDNLLQVLLMQPA